MSASNGLTVLYAEPLPVDLRLVVETEIDALGGGHRLRVAGSKDRAELLQRVAEADVVVVATTRIDAEALAAAPRLRHVQHQGVGYDNIDVAACAARGVTVALTPEGTTTGVAEHTFLLLLALYKRLREAEGQLRAGKWPVWELRSTSYEIAGKTIGLVGFGRIGRAVAKRARAFEARVLYYDPFRADAATERELGVAYRALDDLLREADVVSLHLPLSAETRHVVGERELALMKRSAVLLNTARGPLVDECALIAALQSKQIAGAGLDVFEREPADPANPLLQLESVVVTPHISAGTIDAFRTKMRAVAANVARVARGEAPQNAVTH
ncbi:MAG TPA: 2-hydroxyacid dehydrogenase [Chloroflexota bacterium]|nr:2-hydroxyacid dehydrogenase [Chloroflexota bacterium]